jgi:hypothetical protein
VGVVAATQVVAAVLLALSLRDDDPPEAAD